MPEPLRILGLCGSLREKSYNMAALRAARDLAPEGVQITIGDISKLPLYNGDLQDAGGTPEVAAFYDALAQADAFLFVTPEYNYSIPGVLKNAIDWGSRVKPQHPFAGKPAAVFGATPGLLGTVRAQNHLRQIALFLDLRFVNKPELYIAQAPSKFDADGNLTDAPTRERIAALLVALRDWAKVLKAGA